jgi:signal transduction histidine kinase/ligand-binding sensor domain-containing protein
MKRRDKSLLSCCLAQTLALLPYPAMADYGFDVWTTDSGLPHNTVRAIAQSRDGYLWVGTLDGLARFDGVRFTVYNKANSPGLPSNLISAVFEDRSGALWIGTGDGDVVRLQAGRFTAFTPEQGLPRGRVASISGDETGTLWVHTVTPSGNLLFQREQEHFVPIHPPGSFESGSLGGVSRDTIWSRDSNALQLFVRGKVTTLNRSNGVPSLNINTVKVDQRGTCWVATEDAGLVKIQDGKVAAVYSQQNGLPGNRVSLSLAVACEDTKGNLWLTGAGPWLGRWKDGAFTAYPPDDTASSPARSSLPSEVKRVWTLFADREGHVWIGTEGSGLIRAREQMVTIQSAGRGSQGGNIYPIYEDRAGAIWLGTWDKGLSVYKNGSCTNYEARRVTALCEDRQGRMWVGRYRAMAMFQNGILSTENVPHELSNLLVNAIIEDRAGTLWFGAEPGLFRYRHGELTLLSKRDGLVGERISVLLEGRDGALWIGSPRGLARLANNVFTNWSENDGLPSSHVRALYEDDEGVLWIGTYDGGLGRFKDGRFTRYTVRDGMFDNGVFQILEDRRGNFWMSSNRGIHRVRKKELNEFAAGQRRTITSLSYGQGHGMVNPECNGGCWPAGVKARDGKLWFPTQDGAAIVDPESIPTNPQPPPVVIESFLLNQEPLRLDGLAEIPAGQMNIEIQYTALSFINPDRIRFKYRLAHWDDAWVEAGQRRTAYYTHLTPGKYTFAVLSANSDGVWNETGASLAFTVLPAWYQTDWFRVLAGVVLCGVVLAWYRLRIGRLEAESAAQHEFSRRLIESQDAERKRIAAELHDSLGQELLVIKNRALLGLKASPPDALVPEHLEAISQMTSRALQEVRDIAYNLRPYQLDQFGLTEGIVAIVNRLGSSGGIRFTVDVDPIDGLFSPTDESHLFRVIQEATNNIVKHSGATEAAVRVQRDPGRLRVRVEDNGRGFAHDAMVATDGSSREGFGLPGLAERVRILCGALQVRSEPGRGAHLDITIPTPTHGKENSGPAGG